MDGKPSGSTFRVAEASGRAGPVTGTRPVAVPGPWVITRATIGR